MNGKVSTSINIQKLSNSYFQRVPEKVTFRDLVQLWRVMRQKTQVSTALQQQCEDSDLDLPELHGITPDQARIQFAIAAKRYVNNDIFRDIVDASRRVGPVTVAQDHLKSEEKIYPVKNGYVEEYSSKEAVIRQVSDIISTYTTYSHKQKNVTTVFTPEACRAVRVPYLDLVNIRNALEVDDLDVINARNAIYKKLSTDKKYPYFWFYCLQAILHHDSMEQFRTPARIAVVTWYERETALTKAHRFPKYYEFISSVMTLYNMDLQKTWIYALKSDALRGITKKRGVFSIGYYSYPISPVYVKVVSEAADILSVCHAHKIEAIEIIHTARLLCEVLAFNGLIVKCQLLSTSKMTVKSKGIYGMVSIPTITYRPLGERPVLDGKTVKMGGTLEMTAKEIRSTYLCTNLPYSMIYPSCRAADGVVMVYYDPATMSKPGKKSLATFADNLQKYSARFTCSITWRNNFLFTKVPYYCRDPYRNCFRPVGIPALRDDSDSGSFNNAILDKFEPSSVIMDDDLSPVAKMKVKAVPVVVPELTDEIYQLLLIKSGLLLNNDLTKDDLLIAYRAIQKVYYRSKKGRVELEVLFAGNEVFFRLALLRIENSVMLDRDPNDNRLLLDYFSMKSRSSRVVKREENDDVPYESSEEERGDNDDENRNDDDNPDGDGYQPEVEDESPDVQGDRNEDVEGMFDQILDPGAEGQQ